MLYSDTTYAECPCGKGKNKRLWERWDGFLDGWEHTLYTIECPDCAKRYVFLPKIDENTQIRHKDAIEFHEGRFGKCYLGFAGTPTYNTLDSVSSVYGRQFDGEKLIDYSKYGYDAFRNDISLKESLFNLQDDLERICKSTYDLNKIVEIYTNKTPLPDWVKKITTHNHWRSSFANGREGAIFVRNLYGGDFSHKKLVLTFLDTLYYMMENLNCKYDRTTDAFKALLKKANACNNYKEATKSPTINFVASGLGLKDIKKIRWMFEQYVWFADRFYNPDIAPKIDQYNKLATLYYDPPHLLGYKKWIPEITDWIPVKYNREIERAW